MTVPAVTFYDNSDAGAPTLNNAAGSILAVLQACLVDGYNAHSCTISVASGIATVTCSGHGFKAKRVVEIAGAAPSELNGRQQVATVADSNTFTFATTASDGSATGSITVKTPGLGWTTLYSATNKAIFQRTDPDACPQLLYVDDTRTGGIYSARIKGLESATDISTLGTAFPTDSQVSGGLYWSSGNASTNGKPWRLWGDGRRFYLWHRWYANSEDTSQGGGFHFFGDLASFKSSDSYCTMISGSVNDSWSSSGTEWGYTGVNPGFSGNYRFICRKSDGSGGSNHFELVGFATNGFSPGYGVCTDAAMFDGIALVMPQVPVITEEAGGANSQPLRGIMPGLGQSLTQQESGNIVRPDGTTFVGPNGHDWMWMSVGTQLYQVSPFDIEGPWS